MIVSWFFIGDILIVSWFGEGEPNDSFLGLLWGNLLLVLFYWFVIGDPWLSVEGPIYMCLGMQ